jgi:hypothetical protein
VSAVLGASISVSNLSFKSGGSISRLVLILAGAVFYCTVTFQNSASV